MVETMGWFIKTGDYISCDQRFDIQGECYFDDLHNPDDLINTFELWQCEDKFAPRHPSKAKKLRRNCTVTVDLRQVAKEKFISRTDTKGKLYHELCMNLIMTYKSAVMTFSVEVDGEEMGSTEVDYA
ncbi:hypothetical protein E4U10_005220 [Claviceps purpurea]|nr:hypothetical protein E4U10_005220 [Claviceps purpurea]